MLAAIVNIKSVEDIESNKEIRSLAFRVPEMNILDGLFSDIAFSFDNLNLVIGFYLQICCIW